MRHTMRTLLVVLVALVALAAMAHALTLQVRISRSRSRALSRCRHCLSLAHSMCLSRSRGRRSSPRLLSASIKSLRRTRE